MIRPTDLRLRLVHVPEREVLDWFASAANSWASYHKHGSLLVPMISGLPEDTSVLSVHHDFMSKSFQFTIHSSTFSESLDGAEIPLFEGSVPTRYESVELRIEADRQREKINFDGRDLKLTHRSSLLIPSGYHIGVDPAQEGSDRTVCSKAMLRNPAITEVFGKTLVVNDDPAGADPSEADAMFAFFKASGKSQ